MKIGLACTCGKQLQVDASHAGKRGQCPQCGRVLYIPQAEPSLPPIVPLETAATVAGPIAQSDAVATLAEPIAQAATKVEKPPTVARPAGFRPQRVRPWVRFWARQFDLILAGYISLIPLGLLVYANPQPMLSAIMNYSSLLGVPVTLFWVFVETALLATIGTTPGKRLFKTSVAKADSSPLSFNDAFSRSSKVWYRGLGLGLPLVPLFTFMRGQENLVSHGRTTWDRDCETAVSHGQLGIIRVGLAVTLLAIGYAAIAPVAQAGGRWLGTKIAKESVVTQAKATGEPAGVFGTNMLMSMADVKRVVPGVVPFGDKELIIMRKVYDRDAKIVYHFEGDRLVLVLLCFQGESTRADYDRIQKILVADYGPMETPRNKENPTRLSSEKIIGRFDVENIMFKTLGVQMQQVLYSRTPAK